MRPSVEAASDVQGLALGRGRVRPLPAGCSGSVAPGEQESTVMLRGAKCPLDGGVTGGEVAGEQGGKMEKVVAGC